MPPVNVSAFARLAGVSRETIYKKFRNGLLVQLENGTVDTDDPLNADYLYGQGATAADVLQVTAVKPPAVKKPRKPVPVKPPAVKPPKRQRKVRQQAPPVISASVSRPRKPEVHSGTVVDAEAILSQLATTDVRALHPQDVAKVARLESAMKTRVEREHKRGVLIERDTVRTVFARLYSIDSNELQTLGSRLAPAVCGRLGVEDPASVLSVEQMIDEHVFKVLAHIKRVFNDYLVSAGGQPVQ